MANHSVTRRSGWVTFAGIVALVVGVYHVLSGIGALSNDDAIQSQAADVLFGGVGATIMAALVVVSTFGAVNGIILAGPRVYYQMAQDGTLFPWLGAVHPRFGTPHRAMVVQAIWAAIERAIELRSIQ